jgi:hypothetical protein
MTIKARVYFLFLFTFFMFANAFADRRESNDNYSSLQVTPASVNLIVGATASLAVSNASGRVSATSNQKSIVSAAYSNKLVTLIGLKTGITTVEVKDNKTTKKIAVTVSTATPINGLTVSPSEVAMNVGGTSLITVTNATGTVTAHSDKTAIATVSYNNGTAIVTGKAQGSAKISIKDAKSSKTVLARVINAPVSSGAYTLLAWNDLGMHCMDGLDYSVFSILPPYNSLHAQLKNKAGSLITSGVTLTYEAIADSSGSINTYSASKSPIKTNFWDKIGLMLGLPPNTPPTDIGLNLDGMSVGTPSSGNPTPSLNPAPMTYNTAYGWFEAEGIPITPIDDAGKKNFYPTVKVVAKETQTGKIIASTTTVLPVSDEMTCKACHSSTSPSAAQPSAGWVNDPNIDKDWKRNILKLHDERHAASQLFKDALNAKGYSSEGLLATADAGKPVLCVLCHASNAYTDKSTGLTVMGGYPGISAFTQALHTKHAKVNDPITGSMLDDINNRTSCYLCHPGSETQCLRGAMSKAVDTNGKQMSCQNCHGNLSAVGHPTRKGWLEEPTCQSCHNKEAANQRGFVAVDADGKNLVPADRTFASNDNAPLPGLNLYRFSKGHGGLQCEACHGATHAEYPSTHSDDNSQSIAVQGHAGTVAECTACHTTVPTTVNGGPHGMHTTGNAWVSAHEHANKNGTATTPNCAYCHGTTNAGTPLSAIKVAKTINAGEFGSKNWPAGYQVSCFSCHNGPNPD